MKRMMRFSLLVCVIGLFAWEAGNFPCLAQNAVDPGKVSGYTGNNLSPAQTQGSGFTWKYGFSGSNGRYGTGMHTGNVVYQSEPAVMGMAEEAGCSTCGGGSGTVYNTAYGMGCGDSCFGIMPLVKDVAQVAFTPVHWVASLLSCGTYGDCGCVPIPYRTPCDPCDQCGNWSGCGTCGGAGCASCGGQGRIAASNTIVSGSPATGEMISDGVITEEVPAPGPTSENLPAKAIERSRTAPAKGMPAAGATSGPTTIVVPVQPMAPQARTQARPGMTNMASSQARQQQAPTYVFVTPEGRVIPQDQVREFVQGNQKGKVQYKLASPNTNGIRPVSYERQTLQIPAPVAQTQSAGRVQSGQVRVTDGQGWRTISDSQQYPAVVPQRKYSSGKF